MRSKYFRVIPRDLFNEGKLLSQLGRISLMIHDNTLPHITVNHENENSGFIISQNPDDGSISVTNLHFFDNNGTPIYFFHGLNCKEKFSLQMEFKGEVYWCFDDNGAFMPSQELFK